MWSILFRLAKRVLRKRKASHSSTTSRNIYALVPLGYPRDKFGPLRRRAVEEVTYLDAWGAKLPGL